MDTYIFRCAVCDEGEILFEEWVIVPTGGDGATPADNGYLAIGLYCTSCRAKFVATPETDTRLTLRRIR